MSDKAVVAPRRRSASEWRELIAEQSDSGLSQRAYCKERGLGLSSFVNAKHRYAKPLSASPTSAFLPVALDVDGRSGWEIELGLGDGLTLRLRRT